MTLTPKPTASPTNPDSWLLDIIKKVGHSTEPQVTTRATNSLCVLCKGSRMLCGKTRCPIMVKVNYFLKSQPLMDNENIDGTSPPSVFIGRIGYPNVYVGPLVPPVHEDTAIFDLPEQWFGKSMDEIVGFRSLLIRGKHMVNVNKVNDSW